MCADACAPVLPVTGLSTAAERQELFMALWTMKEAVVKAKGTGINAPPGLKGFSIGVLHVLQVFSDHTCSRCSCCCC